MLILKVGKKETVKIEYIGEEGIIALSRILLKIYIIGKHYWTVSDSCSKIKYVAHIIVALREK